jgi:hypothetical protein
VGSMTTRDRVLVVALFVLSAGICATAAVALVRANNDKSDSPQAIPTLHPTLSAPTEQPTGTPSPSPTASPTPKPTVASPTPTRTATASPSASPRAHVTSSPRPSATRTTAAQGLYADATLTPKTPDTTTVLNAHATDGDGTIRLVSVNWGDGGPVTKTGGTTQCPANPPGDCKDFAFQHTYAGPGTYAVTLTITSSGSIPETQVLHLTAYVH